MNYFNEINFVRIRILLTYCRFFAKLNFFITLYSSIELNFFMTLCSLVALRFFITELNIDIKLKKLITALIKVSCFFLKIFSFETNIEKAIKNLFKARLIISLHHLIV